MDLSGQWAFQLDPQDQGITEAWYNQPLAGEIHLPGSLQAQGFGEDVRVDSPWTGQIVDRSYFTDEKYAPYRQPGNIKVPFWLQPDKVYVGPAWYQRVVNIPEDWQGKRVTLELERPHWETRLWLDGQAVGRQDSLSVPHIYDLGTGLAAGKHILTLRVDNRLIVNVGPNSHSITDHTQTNWNGITGQITLRAGSPLWVENVQVFPNLSTQSARVQIRLCSALNIPHLSAEILLQARSENTAQQHLPEPVTRPVMLEAGWTEIELDYPMGEGTLTWDAFHPALYQMDVKVKAAEYIDQKIVTFGMREVGVAGTQITLNGSPIFLRGTLECCIFPITGYPPTDPSAWREIIHTCKAYGLNHIRFHSWCPPEAAFQVADEEGFYYQVECASWANSGAAVGLGDPLDKWLYEEGQRITASFGNHPSFLLMAYGNEPAGDIETYLSEWVSYWKAKDPRRLYTSGAGWPMLEENQYHNVPEPRIQAWGAELNSRINAYPPETMTDYTEFIQRVNKPVISHEIGQWCAYPNFAEIEKYTGVLKVKNFEIFRDSLVESGMGDQALDFLIASGKLQVLCYKEEIESALRTPGFAGFQLLDLHDFPGQGTALVGVLDPFWDEKGYVTGPEFSQFCNAIVPLARMNKRCWLDDETFHCQVDLANFGAQALQSVHPTWSLTCAGGQVVAKGEFPSQDIPISSGIHLGSVDIPLSGIKTACRYVLTIKLPGVSNPNGQPVQNTWDIWVFPTQVPPEAPNDIEICSTLDQKALAHLSGGGKALLLLPPEQVQTGSQIGFSTIFWNTAWTRNQAPHTLGIICNPDHPVFNNFPTENHTNWQWWELIHHAAAIQLDSLPKDLRPLIQPIDTWFENRRLGLLFEARVNGGSLMVCSIDLSSDLDSRPAARQMRASILRYMSNSGFQPQIELMPQQIQSLSAMSNLT